MTVSVKRPPLGLETMSLLPPNWDLEVSSQGLLSTFTSPLSLGISLEILRPSVLRLYYT